MMQPTPQQQPPAISPGLQALMALQQAVQTGQMQPQTPEGRPTVAAQLAQAAQQQMQAPQQAPQPGMQGPVRSAGIAGALQAQKQQQVQQVMQQMAQQQIAQQAPQGPLQMNTGGLAGLPGADVRMADGGIVGFSGEEDSYVPDYDSPFKQMLRALPQDSPAKAAQLAIQQALGLGGGAGRGDVNPDYVSPSTEALSARWGQDRAPDERSGASGNVQFDVGPGSLGALFAAAQQATGKEKQAILAKIQELLAAGGGADTGGDRGGSAASSTGIGSLSANSVNRSNTPAVYADAGDVNAPFDAAAAANAKQEMPALRPAAQIKAQEDAQRALYGLPAMIGQNQIDYIKQQKAANDALAEKHAGEVGKRPLDNLVAMLTAQGGPTLFQKLGAGANTVLAREGAQRREDVDFDSLLSNRAQALNAVQTAVDALREAKASGDVAAEQAAIEALRTAKNAQLAAEAKIKEEQGKARAQVTGAQISAQGNLGAEEMRAKALVAAAEQRGANTDKGWYDVLTDNVQKEMDAWGKEMPAVMRDPGAEAAKRKEVWERNVRALRLDPRFAGKIPEGAEQLPGSSGGTKTIKWNDIK
jgi:hypothetical protein